MHRLKSQIRLEITIVLFISFGMSALYSITRLIKNLLDTKPLSEQKTVIRSSLANEEFFDFLYQLFSYIADLTPVFLVLYLLRYVSKPNTNFISINNIIIKDFFRAFILLLIIGIPGAIFYFVGLTLGITTAIIPSNFNNYWWTPLTLVATAIVAGLSEEIIVSGYITTRLKQLNTGNINIILFSSLLRGSYHAYQGIGPIIGNIVMGIVFTYFAIKWKSVKSLIIAHIIIDLIVFIIYPLPLTQQLLNNIYSLFIA